MMVTPIADKYDYVVLENKTNNKSNNKSNNNDNTNNK